MSHPTYAWQEPYMAAVYETDEMKMLGRILEATAAIAQRLLSPIGPEEDRAIRDAQRGIETLWVERGIAPNSNGNSVVGHS